MHRNLPVRIAHRMSMMTLMSSLCVLFAVRATEQSWDQKDWKQWTAQDVHEVLSTRASECCWAGQDGPTHGYEAYIASSQAYRQAIARRMQLDKRYQKLDLTRRREVDQRVAACINKKFDNDVVFDFDFTFWDGHGSDLVDQARPDQIHLLTSDGRKIVGHLVADSVFTNCGRLPSEINFPGVSALNNEIAFPRHVDGKPTISPADKLIRIDLDFYRESWPGHSVGEFDFSIDKLIYQGKPDF